MKSTADRYKSAASHLLDPEIEYPEMFGPEMFGPELQEVVPEKRAFVGPPFWPAWTRYVRPMRTTKIRGHDWS